MLRNSHRSIPHAPSIYKQHTPSSTRRCLVSRVAYRQETYLAQTHVHNTEATGNDAHRNASNTWTKTISLHKQQNPHIQSNTQTNLNLKNKNVWYCFYVEHRNPRTLPIQRFAQDCRCTLVRAECGYPKGSPNTNSYRINPSLQLSMQFVP
jgi:hypothetical protein